MDILNNATLIEAPQVDFNFELNSWVKAFESHYNNPDWSQWPRLLQRIKTFGEERARIDITLQAQVLEGLLERAQVTGVHPEWLKHSLYLRSLLEAIFWV